MPSDTSPDRRRPADLPLPVSVVARRLGVAAATLRTWDRRYGLGPTQHVTGTHRRYAAGDLARLETMRRLIREGVPPAAAAGVAIARPSEQAESTTERAETTGPPAAPAPRSADLAAVVRGLGRAAVALDATAVLDTVREQLGRRGLVPTWDDVLRPALVAVGERWAETGQGVEVEHLLAACVSRVLSELAAACPEPPSGRPVLLAGAPGEQHALPLHAMAAGLAERGISSRMLGADLPAQALAAAVRRTGPSVLFVWAHRQSTAGAEALGALPDLRPPVALVVGGPGWLEETLPASAAPVYGLADAVDTVAALAN